MKVSEGLSICLLGSKYFVMWRGRWSPSFAAGAAGRTRERSVLAMNDYLVPVMARVRLKANAVSGGLWGILYTRKGIQEE